jgi:hypothetical protein
MPSPGLLENFVEPLVTAERVQCAAVAVRRSTYEQLGGFNPGLKHALDWEMWIRIASQFPFFYEPKILACWRNHSGATTSRQIRIVVETALSEIIDDDQPNGPLTSVCRRYGNQ